MATFAEYVGSLSDPQGRDALTHAWAVAAAAAPDAVEGTSYGVPALKLAGSPLFAVQATKKHLTMIPFSPEVLDALGDRLAGFVRSKGSVRFSAEHPLPDAVVEEMVRLRSEQITG